MSIGQRQIWYSLVQADGAPFNNSTADIVSVPHDALIVHLRDAVKAKNANDLATVDARNLKVFKNKVDLSGEPIDEEMLVSALDVNDRGCEVGKKKKDALLVLVPESHISSRSSSETSITTTQPQPVLKAHRQKRYKKMSVEASCRKYLDAIATRLSSFYVFDYRHKDGPTIGDILMAKDGKQGTWKEGDGDQIFWDFRIATRTYEQVDADGFTSVIRRGQPLKKEKLPDLYTTDEWASISQFNKKTTERVHDGQLPQLQNGKPYIIIPPSEFTPEMIAFLKNIGVKATLFSSPDDLVVKDEDALSVGLSVA